MYFTFAWRYFKAKKTTNAINIISWVTTGVIAFAVCCQVLVLSVFNGLEDVVKSLYSSFYSDIRIIPSSGKTILLDSALVNRIQQIKGVQAVSLNIEEKALLQNGDVQSVIQLKGVDEQFRKVSGLPQKVFKGAFHTGTAEQPGLVVGAGVKSAAAITLDEAFGPEKTIIFLPKAVVSSADPLESLSESVAEPSGVFSAQQDFDNVYAITNIDYVRTQTGLPENYFSAAEVKLKSNADEGQTKQNLIDLLGKNYTVQTRYEQNTSLYSTMKSEKWIIYAVLTLILVIAAFNMIGALTMLVMEKKLDISILKSMGAQKKQISLIFLTEGLMLGGIGALIGLSFAYFICLLQIKLKLIKISGSSFVIDYFPVKLIVSDFFLVSATVMFIILMASWLPVKKASGEAFSLK